MLPKTWSHPDPITLNPTPGHQSVRACAIFSGETFRSIDNIVNLPAGRRRKVMPRPQWRSEWERRVGEVGARFAVEFQDTRREFGWDGFTKTIDVIDPEYLNPTHPLVFPEGNEAGITYSDLMILVRDTNNEGGEEIFRRFEENGLLDALKEFVRVAVHTVYIGEVSRRPHAVYDKVYVNVGVQGTWDNSNVGTLAAKRPFEINLNASDHVRRDDFGLAPLPVEQPSFLEKFRSALGCPVDIDRRYTNFLRERNERANSVSPIQPPDVVPLDSLPADPDRRLMVRIDNNERLGRADEEPDTLALRSEREGLRGA